MILRADIPSVIKPPFFPSRGHFIRPATALSAYSSISWSRKETTETKMTAVMDNPMRVRLKQAGAELCQAQDSLG